MRHANGFTLIEVMIAIALMAVLLTLAMPGFTTYLNNVKLRTAAQTFLAGVQTARGEAIRRNAGVDFVVTNGDVSGGNLAPSPSSSGQNWMIRTSDGLAFVEGKSGAEGSGRAIGETLPYQLASNADTISFSGLGAATALLGGVPVGTTATFQFTPTSGNCASAGGAIRCLNVVVVPGGRSWICDPGISPAQKAAGDTRGCP